MSPTRPQPRPALRTAEDGRVLPARPFASSLAVDDAAVAAAAASRAKKSKKNGKEDDKPVELVVVLPRSVRKRLRKRAEDYGWSPEEAAAHVLRVWAGE